MNCKKSDVMRLSLRDNFSRENIPLTPGVYLFLSEEKQPIYVGKAKRLRSRVLSYFRSPSTLAARTRLMVQKAFFLEILLTRTEKEALILEAELINKHKPRYNIRLRDDKAYPFLRLGIKSTFPRLSIVRNRRRDGALYFGPYTSSLALRQTLRTIFSCFRLRSCSDRAMRNRARACLKFQVQRCSGPCIGAVSREDYMIEVEKVKSFLEGRASSVVNELERAMNEAASMLEFERAALYRDQIDTLKKVLEDQVVVLSSRSDMDVISISVEKKSAQAAVLKVREGAIRSRHLLELDVRLAEDMDTVYANFLKIYYSTCMPPPELILPVKLGEREIFEGLLSHYRGKRVYLKNPVRGQKKNLLEMAQINARQGLMDRKVKDARWKERARLIKERLRLKRLPGIVEGIDISNISGSLPVGSLVKFSKGEPDKGGYRHYFLESEGPDDYAMIFEVMERRIKRGIGKKDLPDLFIIDGGRGQLNAAIRACRDLDIPDKVDIISLAKARDGEGEKIFLPKDDSPLFLETSDMVLRFCQQVRDEAHRFAVKTHRARRSRKIFASELLRIPGIGSGRQTLLLNHFGSVEQVAAADVEELEDLQGISRQIARNIREHFRKEKKRGKD